MRRDKVAAAALIITALFIISSVMGRTPTKAMPETERAFEPTAASHLSDPVEIPALEAVVSEIELFEPDISEVEALARMLYGEARGVPSAAEKAACVWCVLNRVDDPRFPDTVLEVLQAPYQFAGYKTDYPLLPELVALAVDVLTRYHIEKDSNTDAGRVLPAEYVYFTGDGMHNYFTMEWKSKKTYQWTLTNPYED